MRHPLRTAHSPRPARCMLPQGPGLRNQGHFFIPARRAHVDATGQLPVTTYRRAPGAAPAPGKTQEAPPKANAGPGVTTRQHLGGWLWRNCPALPTACDLGNMAAPGSACLWSCQGPGAHACVPWKQPSGVCCVPIPLPELAMPLGHGAWFALIAIACRRTAAPCPPPLRCLAACTVCGHSLPLGTVQLEASGSAMRAHQAPAKAPAACPRALLWPLSSG